MIAILAPGISVTIEAAEKVNTACTMAKELMEAIFYTEDFHKDVISIHKDDNDCFAEILVRDNGFTVNGVWYCMPDAETVVSNLIADNF